MEVGDRRREAFELFVEEAADAEMLGGVGPQLQQQLDGRECGLVQLAFTIDREQVAEHASQDAERADGLQRLRQRALDVPARRSAAGTVERAQAFAELVVTDRPPTEE